MTNKEGAILQNPSSLDKCYKKQAGLLYELWLYQHLLRAIEIGK